MLVSTWQCSSPRRLGDAKIAASYSRLRLSSALRFTDFRFSRRTSSTRKRVVGSSVAMLSSSTLNFLEAACLPGRLRHSVSVPSVD